MPEILHQSNPTIATRRPDQDRPGEMLARASSAATATQPKTSFVPEPPHELKVRRSAFNGDGTPDKSVSRHEVIETALGKLAKISTRNPQRAGAIAELASDVKEKSARWYSQIEEEFHEICEYERVVRGRAITIAGIRAKETLLESARATLDSTESLSMSGEELLVLSQRVKHLPTVIAAEWAEIPEHENRIRALEQATQIPVARIIEFLLKDARNLDGRFLDTDLQRAQQFLPLTEK
jgi:hypothetical protein